MYEITFKKKAGKELAQLPSVVLPKVVSGIDDLASDPRPSGSKKLKGSDEDMWRIRIGDYRVIYVVEDEIKIVNIRKVGHRKDVYRK
ncbi:MAG: type II toxin-antitoxin system RelE/ParE family toxin [Cyclobacteriaceae bacterium]